MSRSKESLEDEVTVGFRVPKSTVEIVEKLLLERRLLYFKLTDELLHVDEPAVIEYSSFNWWFLDKELCDVNTREALIKSLERIEAPKGNIGACANDCSDKAASVRDYSSFNSNFYIFSCYCVIAA